MKKLQIQNAALLCKWWWRYGVKKEDLWVRAINGKYGLDPTKWLPSMNANQSHNSRVSRIWGDISLGSNGSKMANIISKGFWIKVGACLNTSFWNDV